MAFITLKPALLAAFVAVLSSNADAFTSPMRSSMTTRSPALNMAKEDESIDKVQLTSNLGKEIMFDEKSGRFFETNLDAAECIPEEEYCQVDPETGDRIRLTVAEKERIFLDSLQVCRNFIQFYRKICVMYLNFPNLPLSFVPKTKTK